MMTHPYYPGLYCDADTTSFDAKRTYFRFQKGYLGSLVLGSAAGIVAQFIEPPFRTSLSATMAIVLILGLLILWIMRARQDDKIWFDGRAVAESTKTAAWRFMMKVPPFHEDDAADERFISQLKEIREARPQLARHMAAVHDDNARPITDFMRDKRAATLEARRAFYVRDRLADQRSWYAKKAKLNAASSARWFWIVAGLQMLAAIMAVSQVVAAGLGINLVPVIATCAAVSAAWGQLKRHDELAQTYAIAAQELEELEALSTSQSSIEGFVQLVEQAENSISREHTMWCARRDVRLPGGARP